MSDEEMLTHMLAPIAAFNILDPDSELIVSMPVPKLKGIAVIQGAPTRWEATDSGGAVVAGDVMGMGIGLDANYIERGALVRLTDLTVDLKLEKR